MRRNRDAGAQERLTPEASLTREGPIGSEDSAGFLTRSRPKRPPAPYSCGAVPASHRLPRPNQL